MPEQIQVTSRTVRDTERLRRRAFPRFVMRREALCTLKAVMGDESWRARVANLSAEGVGLLLDRPIETGRLVFVDLSSPSGLFARMVLMQVLHVTARDPGYYVGGELVKQLTPEDIRMLTA
jgi:hypothetical protein